MVTGASGFVGRHLLDELRKRKLAFRTLERGQEVTSEVDTLIHLAGKAHFDRAQEHSLENYLRANRDYALSVAERACDKGLQHFIYVSSMSVYGLRCAAYNIDENTMLNPADSYGISKLKGETALQELRALKGFRLTIVRPSLIYGFDAPGNFEVLMRYIHNHSLIPFTTSNNQRSILSINNFVDFLVKISSQHESVSGTFNVSDNTPMSTAEMVKSLAKGMDKEVTQLNFPKIIWKVALTALGKSKVYQQLFEDLVVDSSLASSSLAWQAPYSTLTELTECGRHFKENQNLK